jgi:hypothetical protein
VETLQEQLLVSAGLAVVAEVVVLLMLLVAQEFFIFSTKEQK